MTVYTSSTLDVPCTSNIPKHVAIVMDGNGRWAKSRLMPRFAGHKRGVDAVKRTVQACCELGVEHLTLFAFSSENWRRPEEEVSLLMRLFIRVLRKDVEAMHRENICLRIIGDTTAFEPEPAGGHLLRRRTHQKQHPPVFKHCSQLRRPLGYSPSDKKHAEMQSRVGQQSESNFGN